MKQFSYIFTYRQIASDRYSNLVKILDWLDTIEADFECIIIEQDAKSTLVLPIKEYHFPIIHKFFYNPTLFNRSWGFNLATNIATTDKLFFADSDMIVPQQSILDCVTQLDTLESVKPFNSIIDLNTLQSNEVDVTLDVGTLQLQKKDKNPLRGGWGYGSGIVAYTKDALKKVYGWDERFKGWGGEDDIQFQKTKQLLKYKMLHHKCYHLYHSRGVNNGTNNHSNYRNNLNLYYRYQKNPRLIITEMVGHNKADQNLYKKV